MSVTTRTVGGSRLINLMLGLLVATALGVASPAQAGGSTHCSGQRTVQPPRTPDRPPPPAGGTSHRGYVVAARMGWAA
jgi:hypothetical protein